VGRYKVTFWRFGEGFKDLSCSEQLEFLKVFEKSNHFQERSTPVFELDMVVCLMRVYKW